MCSVCFVHVCVRATIHFVLTKQWVTVVAMKAVVEVCMREGTSFDMGQRSCKSLHPVQHDLYRPALSLLFSFPSF